MKSEQLPPPSSATPSQTRHWKRIALILTIGLVVLLFLLVAVVWPEPTRNVQQMGVVWHSLESTGGYYVIDSGALVPPPSRCIGTSSFLCSDIWVAFNWSSQGGEPLTFELWSSGNIPVYVLVYEASNLSFGGYSVHCGAPPRDCGEPWEIITNATSSQAWNLDWEEFYNYTTTEPAGSWL